MMRKIFFVVLATLLTTVISASAYQIQSGDTLWNIANDNGYTVDELVDLNALEDANKIYAGQDLILPFEIDQLIGGAPFRPSGTEVAIREDLVAGASRTTVGATLDVNPIIGFDGTRWTMADSGDILFGKLSEGTNNEEIISWTGMTDNTTYYTLTGVEWGYLSNSLATSTANFKRHNSGAKLIITNDDHYLNRQYVSVRSEQSILAKKTYSVFPEFTDATTPTTTNQFATKGYVDNVGAGGFTASNIGDGNTLRANGTSPETVDIATSTDNFWFTVDDGFFKLATTSSSGLKQFWDTTYIATSTWAGDLTVNGHATTTGSLFVTGKIRGATDVYGNGFDGTVDINSGSFSTSDGVISSNTLTRDAHFQNLTLSGGNLNTAGYKLFVAGTLQIDNTYTIEWDGVAGGNGGNGTEGGAGGTAGTAGTALSTTNLFGSVAGIAGAAGQAGTTSQSGCGGTSGTAGLDTWASIGDGGVIGVLGGAGGNTSGGQVTYTGTAGVGGIVTTSTQPIYDIWSAISMRQTTTTISYITGNAGAGGSAGGACGWGNNTQKGGSGGGSGGSGSGGGVMLIVAKTITNAGTISSNGGTGGNGGNGSNAEAACSTNCGGSGGGAGGSGGSGGVITLIYTTLTNTGTISANAGAGGTAGTAGSPVGSGGTGTSGTAGNTGTAGQINYLNI